MGNTLSLGRIASSPRKSEELSASATGWYAHGIPDSGMLQEAGLGQSKTAPAVVTHRGRIWCLWLDFDDDLWYAFTTDEGKFGPRLAFPQSGKPVMVDLNGDLHAVVSLRTGELVHYYYDDDNCKWEKFSGALGALDASAENEAHSTPALAAYHNELFLAYIQDGRLYAKVWPFHDMNWTPPTCISDSHRGFSGNPMLFILDGSLHILCRDASADQVACCYRYDHISETLTERDGAFEGKAVLGVSATSYGSKTYFGYIEPDASNEPHAVRIATYTDGTWQPQESVPGARAADPPQLTVLNGRLHIIFNDDTPTRDLRWFSRPLLNYSLSSWMADMPDDTLLSAMTIPGTHDSCARNTMPFVRTQYLTITQQLALGIRFFDLRLRLHGDGQLYCYHGGVPIEFPRYLSFATVMDDIWAFIRPASGPTETVLISINNDDPSPSQHTDPTPFYNAVALAISSTPPWPDGTSRWCVAPVTPTLGTSRGRAVLLRRYVGHPEVRPRARHGLDLSAWVNNNPDFTIVTPTGVRVRLQDKWRYAERIALDELVESKSGFVTAMMARAEWTSRTRRRERATKAHETWSKDNQSRLKTNDARNRSTTAEAEKDERDEERSREETWFVNFCSAVGDPIEHGEMAQAKWVAVGARASFLGKWVDGVNVVTRDHLAARADAGKRRLGIVPLDYPELPADNDLVARLVETNFEDDWCWV